MLFLQELLAPLAALLHVPLGIVVFAVLMAFGAAGHYAILPGGAQAHDGRGPHRDPLGRCCALRHFSAHSVGDVGRPCAVIAEPCSPHSMGFEKVCSTCRIRQFWCCLVGWRIGSVGVLRKSCWGSIVVRWNRALAPLLVR